MEGTPFGRYRLIELLGRGGMGEVWRAHDTDTDRVVAIKVLPANLSDDEMFQQRFRREAHAAARLNSPHVIPIHHYGEIDGRLYVDMRLIEGRDLAAALAEGPIEPARAVRIIEGIAEALQAAHKVGLVHRDVKPSNILLDENDFAYLIDFGIARAMEETRLTSTGNAIGTFHYMAPERLGDHPTDDARADIYALACVLYECLTGQPPFAGASMGSLVAAHLHTPPPQPSTSQPNIPERVDQVIATGMAKEPDQRYATTIELADAAREAITVPIARPAPTPSTLLPTELALLPPTQPEQNRVTAQPRTPLAESLAPAKPAPPPQPPPPTPTRVGGISRRTTLTLIGGAAVAAIAAAVGIPAFIKNQPSGRPTSSRRTYGAQIELPFTDLKEPVGVAVDTAGNLYVVDTGNKRVLELWAGSSGQQVLPLAGLKLVLGIAVDAAGNVYVTGMNTSDTLVLKVPLGTTSQQVLPFTGVGMYTGVAVDASGNLYVSDSETKQVLRLPTGSSSQQVLPFTGLKSRSDVAVDAAGNLYVTDWGNNRVLKLPVV